MIVSSYQHKQDVPKQCEIIVTLWKRAVNDLRKSQSKTYAPQSDVNKGNVTGISNIIANAVIKVLIKIVMEEEPVLRPERKGRLDTDIIDESVVRNHQ
ncbi:hypothetical protein EON65_19105 [archaeon]|nr:MAG: hypothetical protein EON65_19105 [archaeon]